MEKRQIKNFDKLATTKNREAALSIAEAGLYAINTINVVLNSVKLEDNVLYIQGEKFDLSKFKNIKVVGFGKSSCDAALALEKILGDKIEEGVVIGLSKASCKYVETFAGTHPRPSRVNLLAGKKIYETLYDSKQDELVIVLVSGGGSALLCSAEDECEQGVKLYDSFLHSGKTINEMNTVRKHLSTLKGGGLAKLAYPATVVGLIFSDIPGDNYADVASGPTYKDMTTIEDAERIIRENNLGEFKLVETPKEDKYFEKVSNFVLVSNKTAVEAMAKKSTELGYAARIAGTELYDEAETALQKVFSERGKHTAILGAGEPSIIVTGTGMGGRNTHLGLGAVRNKMIDETDVFVAFASDGLDNRNNSEAAGVIVDQSTILRAEELGLDAGLYYKNFDSCTFFEKTGDLIVTGPTGANVSDLFILLTQ